MCGAKEETLEHFLVECGGLETVRERFGVGVGAGVKEVLLFGERDVEVLRRGVKLVEEL